MLTKELNTQHNIWTPTIKYPLQDTKYTLKKYKTIETMNNFIYYYDTGLLKVLLASRGYFSCNVIWIKTYLRSQGKSSCFHYL